jgi:hypothetical protein
MERTAVSVPLPSGIFATEIRTPRIGSSREKSGSLEHPAEYRNIAGVLCPIMSPGFGTSSRSRRDAVA